MANRTKTSDEAQLSLTIQDFRDAGYPPMMDRPTAAKLLGVSSHNLWVQTRSGKIPATRYGTGKGVYRYTLRDLAAYILNNRTS